MRLSPAVRAKLRVMLDDARVVQAMFQSDHDHHRELQQHLIEARRELDRLKSSSERRDWLLAQEGAARNARGKQPGGIQTYDDVLERAKRRIDRLAARAKTAADRLQASKEARAAIHRPLEQIAAHLKLHQLQDVSDNPITQLDAVLG